MSEHEDDQLDGCEVDFTKYADDPLTSVLRPLFPDGDNATAHEWKELFTPKEGDDGV